ncbi:MAG: flagellar hook-length control protein FliK [Pseudomonadota bacterium]
MLPIIPIAPSGSTTSAGLAVPATGSVGKPARSPLTGVSESALRDELTTASPSGDTLSPENPFARLLTDALDASQRRVDGTTDIGARTSAESLTNAADELAAAAADASIAGLAQVTPPTGVIGSDGTARTAGTSAATASLQLTLIDGEQPLAPTFPGQAAGSPLPSSGNTLPPTVQNPITPTEGIASLSPPPTTLPTDNRRLLSSLASTDRPVSTERAEPSLAGVPLLVAASAPPTTGVLSSTAPLLVSTTAVPTPTPFADQLAALTLQGQQDAELRLSPPHLGNINVRISVSGDQASVLLIAPNPEVRSLVEASLPRLAELLSESGISLGDTSVADGSAQQQTFDSSPFSSSIGQAEEPPPGSELSVALRAQTHERTLDLYV